MGSTTDKIKGLANEAAGNVKQVAGRVLDKPGLEVEGLVQESKGKGQQALGDAKEKIKNLIDKA
ncbi:MAG: CsbD family protein [Proteobacteria bacterium]|nr:CsbD family protein [Pseudomonadota bacterium]